jgi:hypothetical protein
VGQEGGMMALAYADFIEMKRRRHGDVGRDIDPDELHPSMFGFQRAITAWACRKGRAAVFADCGLGKSRIQLEWARMVGTRSLIVAPLSVARQTVREAHAIGIDLHYVRNGLDADSDGLWITNYEMIERFDPAMFDAVVIDESSILKNVEGKTRRLLTEMFAETPLRLACTATPAPNDVAELTNHDEQYYQAIRRCYRFGQTRPVEAHVVLSTLESQIAINVQRKEATALAVTDRLVAHVRQHFEGATA